MGRLFWKFFFIFWVAQFVTAAGVGTAIWILRPQHFPGHGLVVPGSPPPEFSGTEALSPPHPRPPIPPEMSLPWLPIAAGSLVSLVFAGLLAWYFARPIRLLRGAFAAVVSGEIDTRVGSAMGGRNDELADLGKNFDDMAGQLGDLLNAQRNLLHDVSHELRSPMARLQATADLIRQQPERGAEFAERIVRDTERMDRLIGELLTLARLDSGIQDAIPESVDLGEVIADIAEDARIEAEERGCTIDLALNGELWLHGDRELLHRAIENVVRNALHHSPPGGLVRVAGQVEGNRLRLSISDQGRGVPDEALDKIFQPFYRGGGKTWGGGYGLGLAIAERVIAAVDGQIRAKNADSGGLVVEIDLPV